MNTEKKARSALVTWMERIMQERKWTCQEWARRADTAPSNLTRFLASNDGFMLSTSTLLKLVDAAGVPPDIFGVNTKISNSVPVITRSNLIRVLKALKPEAKSTGAKMSDPHAIVLGLSATSYSSEYVSALRGSATAFAVLLELATLDVGGFLIGDLVVVEPTRVPTQGEIAIVWYMEQVAAYICMPPFFVPRSTDANYLPVPINQAILLGYASQLIRRL